MACLEGETGYRLLLGSNWTPSRMVSVDLKDSRLRVCWMEEAACCRCPPTPEAILDDVEASISMADGRGEV